MNIKVLTAFPEIFDTYMSTSMMLKARKKSLIEFCPYDLRDWTHDRYKTLDDATYGGGPGQLMKCEPIFEAYDSICDKSACKPFVVIPDPTGEVFDDKLATDLSSKQELLFICGHYEGLDYRVFSLADKIISIGDYILTGAELACNVIIDSTVRKLPGVLGADRGVDEESFSQGLLEYPQYTRPKTYRNMSVPDVLLSGNHKQIDKWRHEQSLLRTYNSRPDLINNLNLTEEDKKFLDMM